MIEVLDPTYDEDAEPFKQNARLTSLEGITVGIVSNGKQGTGRFFAALGDHLQSAYGVATVDQLVKPNYSAPAGDQIMDGTSSWQAMISGIGD